MYIPDIVEPRQLDKIFCSLVIFSIVVFIQSREVIFSLSSDCNSSFIIHQSGHLILSIIKYKNWNPKKFFFSGW